MLLPRLADSVPYVDAEVSYRMPDICIRDVRDNVYWNYEVRQAMIAALDMYQSDLEWPRKVTSADLGITIPVYELSYPSKESSTVIEEAREVDEAQRGLGTSSPACNAGDGPGERKHKRKLEFGKADQEGKCQVEGCEQSCALEAGWFPQPRWPQDEEGLPGIEEIVRQQVEGLTLLQEAREALPARGEEVEELLFTPAKATKQETREVDQSGWPSQLSAGEVQELRQLRTEASKVSKFMPALLKDATKMLKHVAAMKKLTEESLQSTQNNTKMFKAKADEFKQREAELRRERDAARRELANLIRELGEIKHLNGMLKPEAPPSIEKRKTKRARRGKLAERPRSQSE